MVAWGTNELLHLGGSGGLAERIRFHRPDCAFGPGFYRIVYESQGQTQTAYFEQQAQADTFIRLLPPGSWPRAHRDAGCLDAHVRPATDAMTPETVDAEQWLAMPRAQAMAELGLKTERQYAKVALAVEGAMAIRNNRETQGGVRVPIVLRRRKDNEVVRDLPARTLTTMRLTGHTPKYMLPRPGQEE